MDAKLIVSPLMAVIVERKNCEMMKTFTEEIRSGGEKNMNIMPIIMETRKCE